MNAEWIITSSALVLIVVGLRAALRGKISPKLQYALWALVLLRLLLPVSLGKSPVSVMNAAQRVNASATEAVSPAATYDGEGYKAPAPMAQTGERYEPLPEAEGEKTASIRLGAIFSKALPVIWLCGAAVTALTFLISNLIFEGRLRWARKPLETDLAPLPVYMVAGIPTPCLFGLFRPAIYVTPETAGDERRLRHVLVHETTHYMHRDGWWSLLRCAALCLHWYNPLVWLAAVLSRRDGEMACDEAAVKKLGEGERQDYGRTLIGLVTVRRGPGSLLCCATTMTSGKRGLKERIKMLAKKPKTLTTALICLLLIAALAAGCTFTGAKPADEVKPDEAEPSRPADTEPQEDAAAENVYNCDGLEIAMPDEYAEKLLVVTEAGYNFVGKRLITVYEKASYEAAKADGVEGMGFLFGIEKLTQSQYEQYLRFDHSGCTAFGRDGEYYYIICRPTDVQYYRGDGVISVESQGWKEWETLCNIDITGDIIARNDLMSYSDSAFYALGSTYEGDHVYLVFAPYYTNGGGDQGKYYLMLSQPVTKGEGGIWCVERMCDGNGNVYYYFPDTGVPAAEYYGEIQEKCDGGGDSQLLTPVGAAMAFAVESGYWSGNPPVEESFRTAVTKPYGFMSAAERTATYIDRIDAGEETDPYEILKLAWSFGRSTWTELEGIYGEGDWWNTLYAALDQACVGDGQEARDRYMFTLYLTSDGAYSEGLCSLLYKQREADAEAFNEALSELSPEDAEHIRAAAEYGDAKG